MFPKKIFFKFFSALLMVVFLLTGVLPVNAEALIGLPIVGVTFTVNSILDQPDDLTMPGTCHTAANTCTLRAAIMQANRTSGLGATINIPAGIYMLTIPVSGADGESNGDLNLTTPVSGNPIITITGSGSGNTIIDANFLDRVFHVYVGRTATISGVTIRNGYVAGVKTRGGGIYNEGLLTVSNANLQSNHVQDFGGGVSNSGSLTVVNSTISQNSSIWGGGIEGGGVLSISGTTISGNSAQDGGGIFNQGSLTLKNSTLSGNQVTGDGGAIFNFNAPFTTANVYNTSIVFNGADSDQNGGLAGGVYNQSGATFNLRNSLVAGNFVANSPIYEDCNGVLNSYGRNLFWDLTSCTVNTASGSWTTLDSLFNIGTLQNNGGPTFTHALLPGSNAIDGGDPVQGCVDESSVLLTTDQRGFARVVGVRCDIGSYEYDPVPIKVYIGGNLKGSYFLAPGNSTRQNYGGVDNGPVKVASTNGVSFVAAIREAWAVNGVTTSSSQMMGLPLEQLSDKYVFPGYNNVTLNEQLRIANVDTVPSDVTVTIGGVLQGIYTLYPPGSLLGPSAVRANYAGLDSGPVIVQGTTGVKIISAIREAWAVNGTTSSFVQLMGLPAGQLSDTYVFPAYNNVTLNEQLRVANVDTVVSTVTVRIGGVLKGTYILYPPGSSSGPSAVRVNYAGLDSGPVIVQGTTGVKIISSMRDAWAVNGVTTSFSQMMGMPKGQLSNKYVFPAYDNVSLNDQLRIANVDSVQSAVTVTIGGVLRGTYTLYPPGSVSGPSAVRINYAGLDSGPVVVEGTLNVKLISAIREAWAVNGVTKSFVQLMGLPAGQLSTTFLFPAYNNVTLSEQLRIAVP